ncbi:MAG: hypothetical protein K5694_02805 [Bacilli bacterium]|nr:hypothetical protein [Bacilli bacterium]
MSKKAKPVTSSKKGNSGNKNPNSFWSKFKKYSLFFLTTLIKNDACVEARKLRWYPAVIIAVLSVFLAVLPISITYFNINGSSILNSPLYNLENSLHDFHEEVASNGIGLEIKYGALKVSGWDTVYNDHYAHYHTRTTTKVVADVSSAESVSDSSVSVSSVSESSTSSPDKVITVTETVCDFSVWYVKDVQISNANLSDLFAYATSDYSPLATIKEAPENCLILGEHNFMLVKLPSGKDIGSSQGYRYCEWNNANFENKNLVDIFDKDIFTGNAYDLTKTDKRTAIVETWKKVFNYGYDNTRVTTAWRFTGIMSGVFAGTILLMGLVVFLMTRGKNNPFRTYTFWQSQKIAYWASFTPAVLAMILCFIPLTANFAMIFFIMLYAFRIMWMSMRSLRPQPQE